MRKKKHIIAFVFLIHVYIVIHILPHIIYVLFEPLFFSNLHSSVSILHSHPENFLSNSSLEIVRLRVFISWVNGWVDSAEI